MKFIILYFMKAKYTFFLSVFLMMFLSSIFAKKDYGRDRDILVQIVRDVCKSYEERNVEKLMSYWSKKSPDYKKTKKDLKEILNDFEDIKIIFSYRGSPRVVFKKDKATVITNNKVTAKYIVRYPYIERGDKIKFIWKKDKTGKKWKIIGMSIIKEEKKRERSPAKHTHRKEKKIKQKFKNKTEEEIAKLSKNAIDCFSKKDINCFLAYNECNSFFGNIRCKVLKIFSARVFKEMQKEEIKIKQDEGKKVKIFSKDNKVIILVPTVAEGKYKLVYPFSLKQRMTVFFRKENYEWKVWKIVIKDVVEKEKPAKKCR